MKHPSVDVIIPAYRPGPTFRTLLERLADQTCPVGHILIINTEERYWKSSFVKGIPQAEVFHITKEEFDHGATRNMGAGFSNADYVVFMTHDAVPADRYLIAHLLKPFRDPLVKVAYARQLPNKSCKIIEGYTRSFNYPEESAVKTIEDLPEMGIKTYFCSNVCAAYDRAFLRSIGGFPQPCIFNEDMVFAARALRLGYGVAYAADARVVHSHNYTAAQQFHRNFDNGVSQAMFPEIFSGIPSEGEGLKLVRQTIAYLNEIGRSYLIPSLLWQSACKYAGFKLGRAYRALPMSMVRAASMNKAFWDYHDEE